MGTDYFKELAIDLVEFTSSLNFEQAREVVDFLRVEGFVDYDQLKEYYEDE